MIPRRKIDMQKGELLKIIKLLIKPPKNKIKQWETEFANYIGVKHAIAVNSGRNALKLILKNLNLKKGDEIIIPAYTLKDLIPIIKSLEIVPVPADIDKETFNINPKEIEKNITKKTKAILATHIFGNPCNLEAINNIAKKHSLLVIEDCAHSASSSFKKKKTGSFGHAAFFSFESIKPINTYGGGMVTTNNINLANNIRKEIENYKKKGSILKKVLVANFENKFLPTFLSKPFLYLLASPKFKEKIVKLYRLVQGHPSQNKKYTEVQAYLGLERLKTLEQRNNNKRKLAAFLKSRDLIPQKILKQAIPNYYFFVALTSKNIIKFRKQLLKKGIDAGIKDEITDNCAILLGKTCKNADFVYKHAIHLPLHKNI